MDALAAYDPHIAGTPPLGVDTDKSDIDILCHAPNPHAFVSDVTQLFGRMSGFRVWQWISSDRPVIATFQASLWDVEIFASPLPIPLQNGWQHFEIERRLLSVGGDSFKNAVKLMRQRGTKTEPAFWSVLQQDGDAYLGLLSLKRLNDDELREMITNAGFEAR